jgi:hypothetical protein
VGDKDSQGVRQVKSQGGRESTIVVRINAEMMAAQPFTREHAIADFYVRRVARPAI